MNNPTENKLTFLGTGTSQGIPMIACDCEVCKSSDPRDHRTRSSGLITINGKNILIDATPELRLQCIRCNVRRVDACLITHTHADHIFGMDDLRRFNQIQKETINIYISSLHLDSLEKVFGYARSRGPIAKIDLPQLNFKSFDPYTDTIDLFGQKITPICLPHGHTHSIGYRIGQTAWCTDLSYMPEKAIEKLQNLDILVLGTLRTKPHPAHLSFDQAIELAQNINAKNTWFIHMSHHVSCRVEKLLPPNIHLAHDALEIPIS